MEIEKQTVKRIEIDIPHAPLVPDLPAPKEGFCWKRKSDGLCFSSSVYFGTQDKKTDFEQVIINE